MSGVRQLDGLHVARYGLVEAGNPGATLGAYVRVLAVLGLEGDLNLLAADDSIGRKLQDLALEPSPGVRRRQAAPPPTPNRGGGT